ncbi:MAG: MBL fold metallo-hydrolase [Verrucomicrobia bacterium]|nr:MBL fold metallo-hydrolase [Verrucomicrobiota bacterium]
MIITNPPVAVTDNLLLLGTTDYPIYLVKDGGEAAVVEGGVGACGPVLEAQLAKFAIAPESVKQIVITHGHPDHVMAVPAFRRMFPGAQVLASQIAAATMGNEKAIGFFAKIDGALTAWLLGKGAITESQKPQPLTEPKMAVEQVLKEGDTVAVGGLKFDVIATPGHSDCSLSFFEPTRKIAIVADVTGFYFADKKTWWPMYFSDYAAYMNSNRRLAALGAEVVCLAHNAVITGADEVKKYFEGAIASAEAYHKRIIDAVKGGKDPRALAGELGIEIHAVTGSLPVDFFQKNCSLLVKNSMKQEGMAA